MPEDLTKHDRRKRRCPRLGHDVTFAYCRAPGAELPCPKIFDCWWETFDVESFICAHFSQADIAHITGPPKDKTLTIYELMQKAQEAARNKPDE